MGDKTGLAKDATAPTETEVVKPRRPRKPRPKGFRHPAYRITCENPWDHVLGHEIRIMPGDFLHLKITTLYKHPTVEEARGGVAISFGDNVSYVTIDNLNRAYRLFTEATWYGVEVIYAPVAYLEHPPNMRDMFHLDEAVVGGDTDDAHK